MIRVVIIDDEDLVRVLLRDILKFRCPEVEIVGEASGIKSGLEVLGKVRPDLVLLDVKLEDGTGFELLQQCSGVDFKVIFITAFEEYALKAIRLSAVDYILKPIAPDELKNAIEKASLMLIADQEQKLKTLVSNLGNATNGNKKIVLKTHDKFHFIPVNEIYYCESDSSYTKFYLQDGNEIMVSRTLKEFEEILMDHGFYRTHKSFLINLKHIRAFQKSDGGYIIMVNNSRIPLSDKKKEEFLRLMENM